MKGAPTGFWGKLSQDEDGVVLAWHPLVDHCADVAACFEALLLRPLIRRRLARLVGLDEFSELQRQRLCVLAALHDLGKHNAGFQRKSVPGASKTAGHVSEALALFQSEDLQVRLGDAVDIDAMASWVESEDGAGRLLIAAISHHGQPRSLDQSPNHLYWKTTPQGDPFDGIAKLTGLTRGWFPLAWEAAGEPLSSGVALQHGLCGLITLADWLGSDTRFFPFSNEPDSGLSSAMGRMASSRERAKEALLAVGLDVSAGTASLGDQRPGFELVCPFDPRPAQAMITELPADPHGSITVLEAETGSGKTEAALARFVVLLQAGLVDGLYFALPTRTAATQIHERVVTAVRRAFPDEATRPPVVLAVPGYLRVDEAEGVRLSGFKVLWPDEGEHRHRGWAAEHPKRYLAGAVVVGTIDQVLLSTLQVSHSHLRAVSLLRHLLVVDEVHASDIYMTRLLESVLCRHLEAGGHALLMSATLGAETRARLLSPGTSMTSPTYDEACEAPYPLITHRTLGDETRTLAPGEQRSAEVSVDLRPVADEPVAIAGLALDAAASGAKILVIRNTVTDCLATQTALEAAAGERGLDGSLFSVGEVVAPHHSRFSRPDRELLDQAIEAHFGKKRPEGGCVVIATQTVQQSLDLDADLMLTDLCPMDVLLQRLGRLHRHQRKVRPSGFDKPHALVLTPPERDLSTMIKKGNGRAVGGHGLGTVYADLRIIEATWRTLEDNALLTVPERSRVLVESAVHSEVLSGIVTELGGSWGEHQGYVTGQGMADRQFAQLNLANWEAHFGEQECLFGGAESDRRIQTRLGEGDRRARFGPSLPVGPFGQSVAELNIPAFLAPPAPDDAVPEDVQLDGARVAFSFGGKRFQYDRLGLRPQEEGGDSDG